MAQNILALGDRFSKAYTSIEHALLPLGNIIYKDEKKFENVDEIIDFIKSHSPLINLVIMPNPYGNKRRMYTYKKLKEINFPIVCFDRGALPDSWFFDIGFNADSPSYHPINWDNELNDEQKDNIIEYINTLKIGDKALEEQSERLGTENLKEELGLDGKKIIFVPFQRPGDTVIQHFSDGYNKFVKEIVKLNQIIQKNYSDEWIIVAKKHPLETSKPTEEIAFVDDDTNIYDLIEIADMVVLINSGVGVLSMLYNKPVYYFGQTFYGHESINRKVSSVMDILYYMKNPLNVDKEKVYRFIHHLKNNVYSFGDFETEKVLQKDGSYRNTTVYIDFYDFKFPKEVNLLKKKFYL